MPDMATRGAAHRTVAKVAGTSSSVSLPCSAGRRLTGTEFEKVSGKEKAKKWKASVRVLHEDGTTGETIGDWLQVQPSVRVLRSAASGPEILGRWSKV